MKYYVKADGTGFKAYNHTPNDKTLVEVPSPPSDARQAWNGSGWGPAPKPTQLEQDVAFIEKGVVKMAGVVISLVDALIANGTIMVQQIPAEERQNYVSFKAAVERIKSS